MNQNQFIKPVAHNNLIPYLSTAVYRIELLRVNLMNHQDNLIKSDVHFYLSIRVDIYVDIGLFFLFYFLHLNNQKIII